MTKSRTYFQWELSFPMPQDLSHQPILAKYWPWLRQLACKVILSGFLYLSNKIDKTLKSIVEVTNQDIRY